ncbi:sensor histidine kinase [Gluconobacter morbifer]|uniref:Two component sensor histidine kinase n=1 Tax=Gluconobacter morbifer G707 TaxID=1088869 RepID=G6XJ70_9PROT|nr:sensor histidine kinase [Gluconobacter morbifer]EHH68186.1 two component sensor histidine kinase [Gluconobacter morbifer G707]
MTPDPSALLLSSRKTSWPRFNQYLIAYLAYLLLYPLPWFLNHKPTPAGVLFSIVALAVFLLMYFAPYRKDRYYGLGEVIMTALLGFATAWTHGDWVVYNIYATGMCARLPGRRKSILMVVILQAGLLAFCAFQGKSLLATALGMFFSILTYIGTWMQWELGVRNLQLQDAQHEIRTLAATAERERIARDMHDLLGHSLTVIAVKAELADRLSATQPEQAHQQIRDIAQLARAALRDVREAVSGMNGASFQRELERARKILEDASIMLTVKGMDNLRDQPQNEVLAMSLREAVTNILRHSNAKHCCVTLSCNASGLLSAFSIEDDGPLQGGQPPDRLVEGNGLRGMRARLAASGGSLSLIPTSRSLRLTATITP